MVTHIKVSLASGNNSFKRRVENAYKYMQELIEHDRELEAERVKEFVSKNTYEEFTTYMFGVFSMKNYRLLEQPEQQISTALEKYFDSYPNTKHPYMELHMDVFPNGRRPRMEFKTAGYWTIVDGRLPKIESFRNVFNDGQVKEVYLSLDDYNMINELHDNYQKSLGTEHGTESKD